MPEFSIIETILWENGGYFLRDPHMVRLEKSLRHFSFPYNRAKIEQALEERTGSFDMSHKYRMRLLLEKTGKLIVEDEKLVSSMPGCLEKITVSNVEIDKTDIFLYHKTTNRSLYDRELAKCRTNGFFDIIFLNKEREVTEGTITNVVTRSGSDYWTPPVSSGLLPGVYREYLLENGELPLKEKVLHLEDLLAADELFMINSVRKMVPVKI